MRLRTIGFISTLVLGLLAGPLPIEAQQAGKVYRIGYLKPGAGPNARDKAFLQGLHDLGWVEGKNIVIEFRYAKRRRDLATALAAELMRLKVDVIVTVALGATRAAMNATRTIPIVFVSVGDPVGQGVIASLARPGGNVTGTVFRTPGLMGKKLELLKEVVPHASRVAVLSNPENPGHAIRLKEVEAVGRSLGVRLQFLEARDPEEIESAFAAMARERAETLLVLVDVRFRAQRAQIADLAAKNRLPAMYGFRNHVEAGGLMACMPDRPQLFWRAAAYVDKILKGAKPGELPVEQPRKFELIVNLKTAKALGITIPRSILLRAT